MYIITKLFSGCYHFQISRTSPKRYDFLIFFFTTALKRLPCIACLIESSILSYNIICNLCVFLAQRNFVGTMGGELKPMDYESESDEEEIDDEENKEGNTTSSRYSNLGKKCT